VPHLDSRRTLRFEPITRDLKDDDPPLRIGRFTDRSGIGLNAANLLSSNKLAFKSKVVSRSHAEIWFEAGKFFIRDTKSSSGTFLNHLRLSPAGNESRAYQLRDGDVLQLGVDYQGGSEDIYKSVKIKVEVGREWQAGANAFKCVSHLPHRALLTLHQYPRHQPTQGTRRHHRPKQTRPLQGQTATAQDQHPRLLHMSVFIPL
jgi:pSer/pThr/pTyr-binding forkhead associated (FHA) protein